MRKIIKVIIEKYDKLSEHKLVKKVFNDKVIMWMRPSNDSDGVDFFFVTLFVSVLLYCDFDALSLIHTMGSVLETKLNCW